MRKTERLRSSLTSAYTPFARPSPPPSTLRPPADQKGEARISALNQF
jgi:hypothetical protein